MSFKKSLLAAALLAAAATTQAGIIYITDGVSSVTVSDESALDQVNGTAGVIAYSGSINNWVFTTTLASSKPFEGSAELPSAHLTLAASSIGAGTLNAWFIDTDYTGSPVNMVLGSGGALGTGASGFFEVCLNDNDLNAECDMSIGSTGLLGGGAYSWTDTYGVNSASNYSLALHTSLVHTQTATSSFDSQINVSEPATLALLGLGLAGLGFARRKQAKA